MSIWKQRHRREVTLLGGRWNLSRLPGLTIGAVSKIRVAQFRSPCCYFGSLKGASKSVQVRLSGTEAVMVLILKNTKQRAL